jgi:hypothetical protein
LPFELEIATRSGRILRMAGSLVANAGARSAAAEGAGRLVLGFRLERVTVDGWAANFVDLAPALFGGYFVPIAPAPISRGAGDQYFAVDKVSLDGERVRVTAQVF